MCICTLDLKSNALTTRPHWSHIPKLSCKLTLGHHALLTQHRGNDGRFVQKGLQNKIHKKIFDVTESIPIQHSYLKPYHIHENIRAWCYGNLLVLLHAYALACTETRHPTHSNHSTNSTWNKSPLLVRRVKKIKYSLQLIFNFLLVD